jgi:hypothetical protein
MENLRFMRFFRSNDDAVYENVRATLDAAWGLPNDTGTQTCIPPAESALRDQVGRIVLPLKDMFCEWEPAASMLPKLLSSGAVEEITEAVYQAVLPVMP